jgi:hypothetical protein
VLWARRVLLSDTLARLVKKRAKNLLFQPEDIARGWPHVHTEVVVGLDPERTAATCVAQKNTAEFVPSSHGERSGKRSWPSKASSVHIQGAG